MRNEIEQAVALLAKKDPHSLERALELLQDTVFSFSMRVCGQREDAEDTMQEVLVKSLPLLPKFYSPRALLVWIYKVAKTRCLMSRRRSRFASKQDLSLDELMPDRLEMELLSKEGATTPESQAIRSQQARRLREAVQKLPPQYRIVLVLRDMEGLTDDEVAEITGLKSGNVRVRLHRARLFVRQTLARNDQDRIRQKSGTSKGRSNTEVLVKPRSAHCRALFAQLSEYLDERLDDSLCRKLEEHVEGCASCKAFINDLEATIKQLRSLPADYSSRATAAKLRRKLLETYPFPDRAQ